MPERLIESYLNGIEVRRTVRNWPEDVKAIVDGYRSYTTISHAVQKDAIQNGWSARITSTLTTKFGYSIIGKWGQWCVDQNLWLLI